MKELGLKIPVIFVKANLFEKKQKKMKIPTVGKLLSYKCNYISRRLVCL